MHQYRILYTYSELLKLHRNFSHPHADKSLNLLKLARSWETDGTTKELLEDICNRRNTRQIFYCPPVRFKISLPTEESLVSGKELSLDLMFLDCKSVLHIFDPTKHFSAASFHTWNQLWPICPGCLVRIYFDLGYNVHWLSQPISYWSGFHLHVRQMENANGIKWHSTTALQCYFPQLPRNWFKVP